MSDLSRYLVTCPKGLELLLEAEVQSLGATSARQTVAGVFCEGDLEVGYRLCLWSRFANRVLLILNEWEADNADDLYAGVKAVDWIEHMSADGTLAVDFHGKAADIRHSHFGALRVKDAIVDQMREQFGKRPSVDAKTPDLRISASLFKQKATVSIDLSGDSLHRRGYRQQAGAAPLKENLGAAILRRANWEEIASAGGRLIDPMCGSGTLLIEAALMAMDIAPGLGRWRFGFNQWKKHDGALWQQLREEATQRKRIGLEKGCGEIRGYDDNPQVIRTAEANIQRAGLEKFVRVSVKDVAHLVQPTHIQDEVPGLVICNPPYGERLSDVPVLVHLYRSLGERLISEFPGWYAGIFTGNPDLCKKMRLRSTKQYKFFNGALPCELVLLNISEPYIFAAPSKAPAAQYSEEIELPEGALMFANRVKKNLKSLSRWVSRQKIDAYRLYDADMPEYSVAVDVYRDWLHVSEYAPPKTIDQDKARKRLEEVMLALPGVTGIAPERIVLKQRQRQSGTAQYERIGQQGELLEVIEGDCKLLVNLQDYLDTGLFLDHRPVRQWVQERSRDQRFLNLFCYTATATVHAAMGGARKTTSVDMSKTYLEWARKNMAINGFGERFHQFEQADCLAWLKTNKDEFDLIFMDPPSFSNSKRMLDVLDVQRDHVEMITLAMKRLSKDGLLLFSNNLRTFKMDTEALGQFDIKDVTGKSFDPDFSRNQRIHQCFEIRHRQA
ncbi:bifunctional 23S rRNA (guanine(2069)-N(7))-methyltransferase RlmK/23S rRNA (guanine(2445)-N(2))-methyltransferase RlmL [Pokkaliibacter sp. CJK22405]|uniref:bifunctional 23S rRNA (guanine(2069)-N(7))-methyltransferase RlmK/23S rRNA (guanine(2445)-N(2))-methyltransferase RlmL n=1 Tax=Pokkaliibacter sp. CJK22405 TaxID=3384615 RepID=UPI0039855B33